MEIHCNPHEYFSGFTKRIVAPFSANDAGFGPVGWDGGRVLFDISVDRRRVACGISKAALEGLSGRRQYGAASLVQCFVAARVGIEAIARRKFAVAAARGSGTLNVWASDLDGFVPPDTPATAHQAVERLHA